jgi:hypothetical protein
MATGAMAAEVEAILVLCDEQGRMLTGLLQGLGRKE